MHWHSGLLRGLRQPLLLLRLLLDAHASRVMSGRLELGDWARHQVAVTALAAGWLGRDPAILVPLGGRRLLLLNRCVHCLTHLLLLFL